MTRFKITVSKPTEIVGFVLYHFEPRISAFCSASDPSTQLQGEVFQSRQQFPFRIEKGAAKFPKTMIN